MLYIITYDLSKPEHEYSELFAEIKSFESWWHFMESTWLIDVDINAKEICNKLEPHTKIGDYLLVIEAGNDVEGWLPDKAWKWIEKHSKPE